jgi:hypothetical protein
MIRAYRPCRRAASATSRQLGPAGKAQSAKREGLMRLSMTGRHLRGPFVENLSTPVAGLIDSIAIASLLSTVICSSKGRPACRKKASLPNYTGNFKRSSRAGSTPAAARTYTQGPPLRNRRFETCPIGHFLR